MVLPYPQVSLENGGGPAERPGRPTYFDVWRVNALSTLLHLVNPRRHRLAAASVHNDFSIVRAVLET